MGLFKLTYYYRGVFNVKEKSRKGHLTLKNLTGILYPLMMFTPFQKTIYIGLVKQIVTNIENIEKEKLKNAILSPCSIK